MMLGSATGGGDVRVTSDDSGGSLWTIGGTVGATTGAVKEGKSPREALRVGKKWADRHGADTGRVHESRPWEGDPSDMFGGLFSGIRNALTLIVILAVIYVLGTLFDVGVGR